MHTGPDVDICDGGTWVMVMVSGVGSGLYILEGFVVSAGLDWLFFGIVDIYHVQAMDFAQPGCWSWFVE